MKNKKYAVFVDYVDASQAVFDSFEEAEEWFNKLKRTKGSSDIKVYMAEAIAEDFIGQE